MPTVTVSDKGQITLPASLRRKLRISPRSRLEITVSDDKVILTRVKSISELAGVFAEHAKGRTNDWEEIRRQTEEAVAQEAARE